MCEEKITPEEFLEALEAEEKDFQRWCQRMNARMDALHESMKKDDLGCHKTQLSQGGESSD